MEARILYKIPIAYTEGLWTYIYYSYSVIAKKAVAFIKYGKEDPKNFFLYISL